MFIDESGADLTVTVDGEEYHSEVTVDFDADGVDDTAVVETDDGSIAFTDTDSDGQADLMTQLDADGEVVGQARFDAATGEWVHIELLAHGGTEATGRVAGSTTVDAADEATLDTPTGEVQIAPLAHDTDGDAAPDTVVVTDAHGDTVVLTDADEDGAVDYATEITGDGRVTVSEHTAGGDWAVVEQGHLDEHGEYHRDSQPADEQELEESGWISSGQADRTEVRIDPRTGDWTR